MNNSVLPVLLQVRARINQLREELARLSEEEQVLMKADAIATRILSDGVESVAASTSARISVKNFVRLKFSQQETIRVKALKVMVTAELGSRAALGTGNAVSELTRTGEIRRVAQGLYAAVPTREEEKEGAP